MSLIFGLGNIVVRQLIAVNLCTGRKTHVIRELQNYSLHATNINFLLYNCNLLYLILKY